MPFQSIARLAVNQALLRHFPQITLEKSASFNGGFYSVVRLSAPVSAGYEKELERQAKGCLKKDLARVEEIEMELQGARAYFKHEGREGEMQLIEACQSPTFHALRLDGHVDPWPSSTLGIELPKSLDLHLFEPQDVSDDLLKRLGLHNLPKKMLKMPRQIIFGLCASGKKELKELLRQKRDASKSAHIVKAKDLFVFSAEDSTVVGYSEKGLERIQKMQNELISAIKSAGFTSWKPMQNGAFKEAFKEGSPAKVACLQSAKEGKEIFEMGLFSLELENRVEIEACISIQDLEEKMISSLQLIETLFKLWGIEVKKELVSLPNAFVGFSSLIQATSPEGASRSVRGQGGAFALHLNALDAQGTFRRLADVHAAPVRGEKSKWYMKIKCYIDDILAVRIETNA